MQFFSDIFGLRLNESMGAEPADMEPTDAEHQLHHAMAGGAGMWGTRTLPCWIWGASEDVICKLNPKG